jgi:hypothetical protein
MVTEDAGMAPSTSALLSHPLKVYVPLPTETVMPAV